MLNELNNSIATMASILATKNIEPELKSLTTANVVKLLSLYAEELNNIEKFQKQQSSAILQPMLT